MVHTTPTRGLLTTPWWPVVAPRSGALAHGVRLLDRLLHDAPTPQKLAAFEAERSMLLREVGRRIMAWVVNHVEPENVAEALLRLWCEGRLSRRRGKQRRAVATLFGTGDLRRRLDEPLERGVHSMHPLERRLGIEAGVATPAFAERVGP